MTNEIIKYQLNAWMAVVAYKNFNQTGKTYEEILKEKSGLLTESSDFTDKQAEEFVKRYQVKYQYADDITGFGATLFWDTEQNKHIVAIRGTEATSFKDILNDAFLGIAGVAYEQEIALESFYTRISTPKSKGGLGLLFTNEKIDVTGHSLGGFLTQVFTSKHQDIISQAHTYNSPGIDGIWGEEVGVA